MASTASTNGSNRPVVNDTPSKMSRLDHEILQLNIDLKNSKGEKAYTKKTYTGFHGDVLIGDKLAPKGFVADLKNSTDDFQRIFSGKNIPTIMKILGKMASLQGFDMKAAAPLVASMSNDSNRRRALIESNVKSKYDKMLHPPLTYLGDAFQYRTADGKFNNVMSPHLGQAGAPYAKTVPSKTHQLGALPDPGDLFDRLMARNKDRPSKSGLSSMLIYHATIIIHDIFRTNDSDKNISDSSSYLDLSPLYGYTMEMQRKVRDDRYKLGLLKPDTFAEDRLLRQPPGVCIMLVMYNRYHNYAATQLRRINENGRFSIPSKYQGTVLEAVAKNAYATKREEARSKKLNQAEFTMKKEAELASACSIYNAEWKAYLARQTGFDAKQLKDEIKNIRKANDAGSKQARVDEAIRKAKLEERLKSDIRQITDDNNTDEVTKKRLIQEATRRVDRERYPSEHARFEKAEQELEDFISKFDPAQKDRSKFETSYSDAWAKLDDDLFNTARLITCGMYIQVAIHDYLRALMGFHQWDTNFTLEPRSDIDHHNVSRGIGNQVTVEFNLLYRFHCAISKNDEEYTKEFMTKVMGIKDPDSLDLKTFTDKMAELGEYEKQQKNKPQPWQINFGIPGSEGRFFERNPITGLFDDQAMINALTKAMDDPISNFGPQNVPKCLKPVEIMGIMQARKWEIGTLNDFREFFGMARHQTFESVTKDPEVQCALRDLYEHPDKIELYPGIFCESDANKGLDPGPTDIDSALWSAIFSDAITLVRSDRFYTTDWNTNSLTSWGMKEVTPDNGICKSSVFHRLIQRAFPEWYHYDSIQFFHPFYTRQTNAKFAAEQGYAPEFRMSQKPVGVDQENNPIFNVENSLPRKPWKPVYIADIKKIGAILSDSANFVHPALRHDSSLPKSFHGLCRTKPSGKKSLNQEAQQTPVHEDVPAIMAYFTKQMKDVVKRESITMNSSTLQIDATRDFAIPVVTKYVADFLGFGHLLRSDDHPKAPYSENEIYQHISNCQVFLAYNSDETKLLKRRKAFRQSMEALHKLVLSGNIAKANRWATTKYFFGTKSDNAMTRLGYEIAERVLQNESDAAKAAAIMVFVGLHAASNSVLAFTSVLNRFLEEMYEHANPHMNSRKRRSGQPKWLRIQQLAFQEGNESELELQKLVLEAERRSINLPVIRQAITTAAGVEADHIVILDIRKANEAIYQAAEKSGVQPQESSFLTHKSTATDRFAEYQPKRIADIGITAMIKIFAQMRDVRRGHDTQGRVKRVRLDASAEGYTNYMAPMRIQNIAQKVILLEDETLADEIYTEKLLKPEMDTYLNAEWDEMVTFPNTWKIRFDGFGRSTYVCDVGEEKDVPFGKLKEAVIPDDAPPYYQPRGASHYGGSFADPRDVAAQMQAEREPTLVNGCGIGR